MSNDNNTNVNPATPSTNSEGGNVAQVLSFTTPRRSANELAAMPDDARAAAITLEMDLQKA